MVTVMAQVAAVVQVRALAWGLPHATGTAGKKKKKKKKKKDYMKLLVEAFLTVALKSSLGNFGIRVILVLVSVGFLFSFKWRFSWFSAWPVLLIVSWALWELRRESLGPTSHSLLQAVTCLRVVCRPQVSCQSHLQK